MPAVDLIEAVALHCQPEFLPESLFGIVEQRNEGVGPVLGKEFGRIEIVGQGQDPQIDFLREESGKRAFSAASFPGPSPSKTSTTR